MALPAATRPPAPRVHPVIDRLAAYSWRLLVIAAAAVALLWLLGRLWVVLVALVITAFLTRILWRPVSALRSRGWRPGLATVVVLLGFLVGLIGALVGIGFAVAGEADEVGPTVSEGVDDIEEWLINDSPFDVSQRDIDRFREETGDAIGESLRSSGGSAVSGAILAAEAVLSMLLGLVVTFFALKDGERFCTWVRGRLPAERRELAGRMAGSAWRTLGGYLRGAATLGVIEGLIIGGVMLIVGADLALPVAVLTFLAAFIPFAGAIAAGALAVIVTLATAGLTPAIVVLVVAIVVQQLDNDLLAPYIYGRALELHPVLILFAIAAGGALFGFAGSFLAVPVTAVAIGVMAEARSGRADDTTDAAAS